MQHSTIFPYEMAYQVITQRAEKWLQRSVSCGRREMWVLLCVEDQQFSQKQIGRALFIGPNPVVKLLDKMEKKKLLRRVRRADDRREHIVEATEKGRDALAKYLGERPEALRYIFWPLTDEQVGLWRDMSVEVLKGISTAPNMEDTYG